MALAAVACGSTAGPTTPTPSLSGVDLVGGNVAGTWTQPGATRTWTLVQFGFTAGGTSSFSQDNNPYLGAVSGDGTIQGGVTLGVFHFDEFYDRLPVPHCSIDVSGDLKVNGNSMTGPYTEDDSCNGVRIGRITGTLTMQKK